MLDKGIPGNNIPGWVGETRHLREGMAAWGQDMLLRYPLRAPQGSFETSELGTRSPFNSNKSGPGEQRGVGWAAAGVQGGPSGGGVLAGMCGNQPSPPQGHKRRRGLKCPLLEAKVVRSLFSRWLGLKGNHKSPWLASHRSSGVIIKGL